MAQTRKKAGATQKAKPTAKQTESAPEKTQVKTVKVEETKEDLQPLRKGDTFLFIKNGEPVYLTRSVANVLLLRNSANIVIPKGSEYIPPQGSQCDGC